MESFDKPESLAWVDDAKKHFPKTKHIHLSQKFIM
jgi:hypothetical protein